MKSLSKKILTPILAFSLVASAATAIGVAIAGANRDSIEAKADYSAHDLTSLYSACESAVASTSESSLWSAVKTAAADNYHSIGYDGLWTAYQSTDFSGGKLVDMYSSKSSFSTGDKCGTYSVEGDCYNREHTIPQSWWGDGTSNQGCDIYIVYPTDGKINGMRSNYAYGEVASGYSQSSGGFSKWGTGKSITVDGQSYSTSGTVFEINDEYKGDMARAYFYAVTKWPGVNFGQDSNANSFFENSTSKTASNNYGFKSYGLNLMLKWHRQDPVSDWEKTRHNAAEKKQGNRNPYIDHPEYVEYIWGDGFDAATDYISLNKTAMSLTVGGSSDTLTATPSSGSPTISWTNSDSSVASISSNSGSSITVSPLAAGTTTITASATINSNLVTKQCTVTVSASGGSGGGENSFTIAVSDIPSAYSGTSFTASGYSFACSNINNTSTSGAMQWKSGQGYMYNTTAINGITSIEMASYSGGTFTGTVYTGSSSNPSDNGVTLTNGNSVSISGSPSYFKIATGTVSGGAKCGNITIYYNGGSSSTKTLESISLNTDNVQKAFTVGDTFSSTGLVVTANYSNSTSATVTPTSISSPDMSTAGQKTITVSYTESGVTKTATYTITVSAASKTLSSISISGYTTTFTQGDEFSFGGTVTANFSDSTTANVTSSASFTGYNMSNTGSQEVTVSYTYSGTTKTAKYNITVNASSGGGDWIVSDTPYRKAKFGASYNSEEISSYTSEWTATNSDNATSTSFTVSIVNANNNKNGWEYIKTGTNTTITTASAIDKPIGKVSLTISAITAANVTSITLYTSTSSTFSTSNSYTFAKESGTPSVTISSPVANLYYRVTFVCTQTKAVSLDQIGYYDATQSSSTLSSISISDYTTSFDVHDSFSFGGTVTAHYSNSTTANVTSSATFTGYDMSTPGTYTVTVSYGGKTATYSLTVNGPSTGVSPYLNGVAYRLCLNNGTSDYFFTGSMGTGTQQYYGASSTTYTDGVDMYFEANGSGQNIYFMSGNTKNYITIVVSGTHYNFTISTDTPSAAWVFDSTYSYLAYPVDYVHYSIGNTGTYTTMNGVKLDGSSYHVAEFALAPEGYSKIFMEAINCDSTGKNAPTFNDGYTWTSLGTLYSGLKDGAKEVLQSASAVENGSTYVEKAMYRYDYMIAKYKTTTYNNFIGRTVKTLPLTIGFFSNISSENTIAIIVIMSVISVTSLGALIAIRKRKEY